MTGQEVVDQLHRHDQVDVEFLLPQGVQNACLLVEFLHAVGVLVVVALMVVAHQPGHLGEDEVGEGVLHQTFPCGGQLRTC